MQKFKKKIRQQGGIVRSNTDHDKLSHTAHELTLLVLIFFAAGIGVFALKPMLFANYTGLTGYVTLENSTSVPSSEFDVKLDLPISEPLVPYRENVKAQVTINNIYGNKLDATITYFIRNTLSSVVFERSEIVAVAGQVSYPVTFETKHLRPGSYVLGVSASNEASFAVSTQRITIHEKSFLMLTQEHMLFRQFAALLLLFGLLAILIAFFAFRLRALHTRKSH